MQFEQIITNPETRKHLVEMVSGNRLSHALLFLSKEGSGALPLSIAFAQYILCEKVNPKKSRQSASLFGEPEEEIKREFPPDSCGVCASCVKIEKLIHPDLHFSYPVLKKNTEHKKVISTDFITEWRDFVKETPYYNVADWIQFLKDNPATKIDSPANKQGNITRAECDDILHKLSMKAFESDYKILIIWMPEYLQAEGNRLLKLIEEPPPDTLFIFVAEDEKAILPTILSRTQLIKIPSFGNEEIEKALAEKEVDAVRASQIASIADGNIREAFLLLEDAEEDWQKQLREWLNVTVRNDVASQLKWIENISRLGREKQKQFLKYFTHLIEQALKIRYVDESDLTAMPPDEIDFGHRLNKMCSREALEAISVELDKSTYHIERNANAKMLFHSLTIRLHHIIKDKSLILIH